MHTIDGYDIAITRGDSLVFRVALDGRELLPGAESLFTVKRSPRDPEALIEKRADASQGTVAVFLTPEDTDLEPRTYYWDLRVRVPSSDGASFEVETPMEYAALTILPAIGHNFDE